MKRHQRIDGKTNQLSMEQLNREAADKAHQGFAPPRQIYCHPYRERMDWSRFPMWARPLSPDCFDDCCHEG